MQFLKFSILFLLGFAQFTAEDLQRRRRGLKSASQNPRWRKDPVNSGQPIDPTRMRPDRYDRYAQSNRQSYKPVQLRPGQRADASFNTKQDDYLDQFRRGNRKVISISNFIVSI